MMKTGVLLLMLFLLASCGAGGRAVSGPGIRLRTYWPEVGMDRYQAVVYPAESGEPYQKP